MKKIKLLRLENINLKYLTIFHTIKNKKGGITLNLEKPNKLSKDYKVATVSLSWGGAGDINSELNLTQLPVLYNMNFGHTEPMTCLPYGDLAEIDCYKKKFSILEPGVK